MRDSFRIAVDNIATFGDTDVFPFPIESHVFHDKPEEAVVLLETIHADFDNFFRRYPPVNESTLSLVSYTGFRWVTQIDPIWNAYLLGLVISVADAIEAARIAPQRQTIFSYRYSHDSVTSQIFQIGSWELFLQRCSELSKQHGYVLACDISDFYSRIYHHRLENALRNLGPGDTPSRIMTLLQRFSNNTSYGLPIGGPAARLLSELLLNRTDHLLQTKGLIFCRYSDDYRVFANSVEDAYNAFRVLSEDLLRNEGLTLQKSKTRVMTAAEFQRSAELVEDTLEEQQAHAFLRLSLKYDPYSPTAAEDYETLKAAVSQFDITGMLSAELGKTRVHTALTRRLVQAIRFLPQPARDAAVLTLVANLDHLAPVFSSVVRVVRDLFGELDSDSQRRAVQHVRDLIASGTYLASIQLNIAYLLRVLAQDRNEENEILTEAVFRDASPFVQHDIILIMAKWEAIYWTSDQKNYFASMHPWLRRAFLIASYTLGDEGRHWRQSVRDELSPFDLLVRDWASERFQLANWSIPI